MNTSYLPVIHENTHLDLIENLADLEKGTISFSELNVVCQQYRIKAACSILMDDILEFYTSLTQSGQCFLYGVAKITEENRVTSKFTPYLDAIAAQDFHAANEIAKFSTAQYNPGMEYEEDFLYYKLLMSFVGKETKGAIQTMLQQYEELDDSDMRYKICLALHNQDVEGFEHALQELVKQFGKKYKSKMESAMIGEEEYFSEGQIFVEGIALTVIAKELGLKTEKEFKFIPSVLLSNKVNLPLSVNWRVP